MFFEIVGSNSNREKIHFFKHAEIINKFEFHIWDELGIIITLAQVLEKTRIYAEENKMKINLNRTKLMLNIVSLLFQSQGVLPIS